jgi:ABC-type sugar transport system substrate-binding protein
MGWLSIEMLLKAMKNEPIPKVIDTGVLFVDKTNVDSYMEEMKKELSK